MEKTNRAGIEPPPKPRGNFAEEYTQAPVKIARTYHSPTEIHNPMELFATTVLYHQDKTLTIYDKTQSVTNSQMYVCQVFGYAKEDVRVESPLSAVGLVRHCVRSINSFLRPWQRRR